MNFAGSPEDINMSTSSPQDEMSSGEPVDQLYNYICMFHSIFTMSMNEHKSVLDRNKPLLNLLNLGATYSEFLLRNNDIDIDYSKESTYPYIRNILEQKQLEQTSQAAKCIYCDNTSRPGSQLCIQHTPKCSGTLKTTGSRCTSFCLSNSSFCGRHKPSATLLTTPDNTPRCAALYKQGAKKGQKCTSYIRPGSLYCGIHRNYSGPSSPESIDPPKPPKSLKEEEQLLINCTNWTPDQFNRVKSLHLVNWSYTPNKTIDFRQSIALTLQSLQQRYDSVYAETLRDINSAELVSGEFLRMEALDKKLSIESATSPSDYMELFDRRLSIVEECKWYKKLLQKALIRQKAKLDRLPTLGINIPPLPNIEDIMFNLTRGAKIRSEMRHSHVENPTISADVLTLLSSPNRPLPSTSPFYIDTASPEPPIFYSPESQSRSPVTAIEFTPTQPDILPTNTISLPPPPFAINGSRITDPKYAFNNQGLVNRYTDLVAHCETVIRLNPESKEIPRYKAYLRKTYGQITGRKITIPNPAPHLHW